MLPPAPWLDVIQLASVNLLALASLISCFRVIRTSYRLRRPGEIYLTGDSLAPRPRREEFMSKLLDGIDAFPGAEGVFVEEQRFWQKVCAT